VPRVRDGTLVFPPLLLARRHGPSLPTRGTVGLAPMLQQARQRRGCNIGA